jgi:hypothetical protein
MTARLFAILLALPLLAPDARASDLDSHFRRASRAESDARFESSATESGGGTSLSPSRRKAFLLSALLPGLGQRANGSELRSKAFFGLEAMIWTSFIVFKIQEHNRTDDFEEYARAYAGVPEGEEETEYYRILTIFNSVEEYNEAVRIEARALYPISRYPQETRDAYYAENAYGPDRSFRWRTNQNRLEYRLIRNDALNSGRRADYVLVAAVVNRAISAVEAARAAGSGGKLAEAVTHLRASASGEGEPAMLRLGVGTRF